MRDHTVKNHAASLAFWAFEAPPEPPGGVTLVSRLNINLTLDIYP